MITKFVITNKFDLPGHLTVLACDGPGHIPRLHAEHVGSIERSGKTAYLIRITGERCMLNQTGPASLRAFETCEKVPLTVEEAQSRQWTLCLKTDEMNPSSSRTKEGDDFAMTALPQLNAP